MSTNAASVSLMAPRAPRVDDAAVDEHDGRPRADELDVEIRRGRVAWRIGLGALRSPAILRSRDVPQVALRELLVGVEGLALLRGLYEGSDEDASQPPRGDQAAAR